MSMGFGGFVWPTSDPGDEDDAQVLTMCLRCREDRALDDCDYCGHCKWAVKAEAMNGIYQVENFLKKRAPYSEWLVAHGLATL